MVKLGHVPASFGQSYTVPLLKSGASAYGKSVTVNDVRGISISPVISKVFEHCMLDRYNNLFTCSDNQFGLKNSLGVLKLFMFPDVWLIIMLVLVLQSTYLQLMYGRHSIK